MVEYRHCIFEYRHCISLIAISPHILTSLKLECVSPSVTGQVYAPFLVCWTMHGILDLWNMLLNLVPHNFEEIVSLYSNLHLLLIRSLMSVSFIFPSRIFSVFPALKCPWEVSRCGSLYILDWLLLAPLNLTYLAQEIYLLSFFSPSDVSLL